MGTDKDIVGVQISLNVDCIFFAPEIIEKDEDIFQLKAGVGQFAKAVKTVLEKEFNRTDMDDIVANTVMVNYIDEDNIDEYIDCEVVYIDE